MTDSRRKNQGRFAETARRCISRATLAGLAAAACCSSAQAAVSIDDPQDLGDASGDIRAVRAAVQGDYMVFTMAVQGLAGPGIGETAEGMVNRYYYHWLVDTDNNPATGRSNAEYEGNPTGITRALGAERVVMVGWRDGKPNGVEVYDPADEDTAILSNFPFQASGNSLTALVPLAALGILNGQTVAVAAFQEGASEDWKVDWTESATMNVDGPDRLIGTVADPADLGDSAGDIRTIGGSVLGDHLFLWMTVQGIPAPKVDQTLEGMVNRYYYHWLLDTDNNPATGRSNAEYEGNPTGLAKPIGAERVIMIGWRDGKPNGLEVYDPADEDTALLSGFPFQARGNLLTAMIPLSALGFNRGQTAALSAFQEGASESWKVDWVESTTIEASGPNPPIAVVTDPADLGDTSGDIRRISAYVEDGSLTLTMTVEGISAPTVEGTPEGKVNRYYYHWLIDTDNNPATGRSNAEYEGTPTGLTKPIGAERVIMIGWRDGKPNGVEVYDPADEDTAILSNFPFHASGNTLTTSIPLSQLGLLPGQTIALSAFQEGASDDWSVDWIESALLELSAGEAPPAPVAGIDDPVDIGDSSGDIKRVEGTIANGHLVLRMGVHGTILPTVEQTPEGKVNRYYYHWLIDTDNNPATGRSNAEYEGNPTGVTRPVGADLVVMVGWRNGAPNGLEAYDPADEDNAIISDFAYTVTEGVLEVKLPLSELGLLPGQTIALSAFQEGASDDWTVDWVESATLTLSESAPTLSLESLFTGDAWGFEIQLTDTPAQTADTATVQVTLDNAPVSAASTKVNGITKIVGRHPSLLQAGTIHEIGLTVKVGGQTQSRTFVFEVPSYTVLPLAGRLQSGDPNSRGFTAYLTMISSTQTGISASVHSNIAERAEMQLAGELTFEGTETPYVNELNWMNDPNWKGPSNIVAGVINWFEFGPDQNTPINFPEDEGIPGLGGFPGEGIVTEILTYLELPAGNHKLGLYTEGGHKITAGFSPDGPVLSVFDNSGAVERVPSYFARNQFFDVVAPVTALYPIRVLWFQSRRSQEPGLLLEFFSVKDRALHLVNDSSDPLSIRAFRSGTPVDPNSEPPILSISRSSTGLTLNWSGQLEATDRVQGTWTVIGQPNESPMTFQATGGARFFRARNN